MMNRGNNRGGFGGGPERGGSPNRGFEDRRNFENNGPNNGYDNRNDGRGGSPNNFQNGHDNRRNDFGNNDFDNRNNGPNNGYDNRNFDNRNDNFDNRRDGYGQENSFERGRGGPGGPGGPGYGPAQGYGGQGNQPQPYNQPYNQPPPQPMGNGAPNITINIGGGNQGGGAFQGTTVVPQPQNRNYGPDNSNLVPQSQKVSPPNGPIAFGNLGSYTYNQPKLVPCPPKNMPPPPQPMACKPIPSSAKLTREEAKDVLLKWAKSKCCESGKAISEGHITDMYSCNALEYVLETFTEKRAIGCAYGQCMPGQTIDGVTGQSTLPNPWLMSAQPSRTFDNSVSTINVPHSEVLQPCFRCQQYGVLRCANCNGVGRAKCISCNGSGQQLGGQGPCVTCGGSRTVDCVRCEQGRVECDVCKRTQFIKWFLQVQVHYTNHVDKYVNERTELPDDVVQSHGGEVLMQAEGVQVVPIQDCESNDLNQNSLRLIQKAAQAYSQENQLLQRHALKAISVCECTLAYETQNFKAWIIGSDQFVYCPSFPSKCCCTIL